MGRESFADKSAGVNSCAFDVLRSAAAKARVSFFYKKEEKSGKKGVK